MTKIELIQALSEFPDDAIVTIAHELIGDEHYLVRVEHEEDDNIIILHETEW